MGQDDVPACQLCPTVLAHALAGEAVLVDDGHGFAHGQFADLRRGGAAAGRIPDTPHRPGQVDGRGPRRADTVGQLVQARLGRLERVGAPLIEPQHHGQGTTATDGRGAANGQAVDGIDDRVDGLQPGDDQLAGQAGLLDDLDGAVHPGDRGAGCRRGRHASTSVATSSNTAIRSAG